MNRTWLTWYLFLFTGFLTMPLLATQPGQDEKKPPEKKEFGKKDFGGPGGFGGPMKQRRKLIPQFDKDGDGRLNAEERQAAREFLKRSGGAGKGGPGGFGKGGFGKGGFGPGNFMAKPLVEALDTDKDGNLTKAELVAGVKKFFAESDKEKKGSLDETQLTEAITRILPPPPGFPGFPGGPKGGPKDAPKGPPGGGFGFGPGGMFAGAILKRADTKKSGKVTLDDLVKAAETLFDETDKDKKGKLEGSAIAGAINQLAPPPGGGFGGPGGGFGGKGREPAKPGPKVAPADVKKYPDKTLYDTTILRTIFLDFDNQKDWEAELSDFYHTDVEVPATVTVDGKTYKNVGVHFRGNSSYFMVPAGYKHSLNLSFDFVDPKQRLYGYKTMNLLNTNQDPTFLHSVLFCNLSRQYLPAPQANLVKVVINGESWGIFANQQQFNKEFLKENFKTTQGARWKVPGHPGASSSGLSYLGDKIEDYKRHYEIKSKDNDKDWKALIELCRVLNKTPTDQLEEALKPILDIESVLWYLAIDNAAINDDGYWTRASDYNLYRDPKGKFHIIQSDTNETFAPVGFGFGGKGGPGGGKGGPGGGKGDGGGPYALDPLVGMNDARMPLRSKLLAVPSLKTKYLKNVHTIANEAFDWKKLQPIVAQYRSLIEKEVELDTRKQSSLAEFKSATADAVPDGPGSRFSLRAFADGRRSYLLSHPEIKKVAGN